MSKITLESLLETSNNNKSGNSLLESTNNLTARNFLLETVNYDDILSYKINNLSHKETEELTESISISNLDKASLIMDKSNDELMKDIRECQGNISKMKYYDVIKQMLKDLELAYKNNPEVIKASQILHDLETSSSIYSNAFRTNNTFKKVVFYSSAISAIYTIVKEHAQTVDFTSSNNENKIVLLDHPNYVHNKQNDDNIKNLNNNLVLLSKKPMFKNQLKEDSSYTDSMNRLLEFDIMNYIGDMGNNVGSSIGGAIVRGSIDELKSTASSVAGNPMVQGAVQGAGSALYGTATFILLSLTALFVLYLIKRISAKPIVQYIKSYEHILDASKKSNTRGDKNISFIIGSMKKIKTWLQNSVRNKESRNIQEYMKDLQKDNDTIKKHSLESKVMHRADSEDDFF